MSDLRTQMARIMHAVHDPREMTQQQSDDALESFTRNLTARRVVEDELERIARQTRRDGK